MRRTVVAALAAALTLLTLLALSGPSSAAPPTAADLAADCNADGALSVSGFVRFRGGTGTLTTNCFVTMDPGSTLKLRNVDLSSASGGFIVGDAQDNTTIIIARSTLDLGGPIQIAPGCCAGGGEPGRSETDAVAKVRNSTLRGSSVEVSGSIADDRGTAIVTSSTLDATSSSIFVVSSLTGTGGRTVVKNTALTSATTTVISAGPSGNCRSVGNAPAVACT